MKAIKKVMTMVLASGISVYSFAQVNLGLQSATQATTNAVVNTTAITSTTYATTNAVKSTVGATVKQPAVGSQHSVKIGQQSSVGSQQSAAGINSGISSDNSVKADVNGSQLIDKADQTASATTARAMDAKAKTVAVAKSEVNNVKPSANVNASAEAKSNTSVR
jgi:hypothetical protein